MRHHVTWLLGCFAWVLPACGDAPPTSPPAEHAVPRPAQGQLEAAIPQQRAPTTIPEVAVAVDRMLAGLRGEAAAGIARELLQGALPAAAAERRDAVLNALKTGTPTVRWVALLGAPELDTLDDELFQAMLPQSQAAESWLHAGLYDALRKVRAIDERAAERMWRVQGEAATPLRAALLRALGTTRGAEGRDAILLDALDAGVDASVRREAAFVLMRELEQTPSLERRPRELVFRIASVARSDPDRGVRTYLVHAIAALGPAALPDAEVLVDRLRDEFSRVRAGAVTGLVAVGEPAIPWIEEVLGQRDNGITEAGIYVLRRLGTPRAIAALRRALENEDAYVRGRAAMALRGMQVPDVDALAIYRELLADEDDAVVMMALEGVGAMGADAAKATDVVRPLLQHDAPNIRGAARVWLEMIERR